MCGEAIRVESGGIPPFSKSAKDGAPDRFVYGTKKTFVSLYGDLNRTWCEEGELGTKPRGHSYQVRERLSFHLSHHLASVRLYRDFADG